MSRATYYAPLAGKILEARGGERAAAGHGARE
jgi:hypothetical protein